MWLHENIGENINLLRAKEIAEIHVDLIGTACPYCLVMLDDGIKSLELEKTPKVADIIDIVADALA
jgi:Fe-S oxidoreductase